VRRFRSRHLDLGERLAAFRARYGVTQAEVARAVGARDHTAISQWERGASVPGGMLRERRSDLLDGRRWPKLRAAMLGEDGDGTLPAAWDRAVRWYRRASRERHPRATVGAAVAAILDELRDIASVEARGRASAGLSATWSGCPYRCRCGTSSTGGCGASLRRRCGC
jgi:DNA-binding XRE family transcriptional regulator